MKKNVIVQLKPSEGLSNNFTTSMETGKMSLASEAVPKVKYLSYDQAFPAVALPQGVELDPDKIPDDQEKQRENLYDTSTDFEFNTDLDKSSYIVRGSIEEDKLDMFMEECSKESAIMNVFSDPTIESTIICPGDGPLGTDKTVENLLHASSLKQCGLHGEGVRVAIVDSGVNMRYLNSKGKNPVFDAANSWKPASSTVTLGDAPVDHGTMVAFDVCIAAPKCTILDIALLTSSRGGATIMSGFLSDAILAYRHLLNVISRPVRPGENQSLVVNNSWGMFHPSWDFPVGHPGNYSDNPNHPFNIMVRILERAGADILFAAGNCGKDCPDDRCQNVTNRTIYGANSSPYVTTVAGVDTTSKRVGYSSIGPGRLSRAKPDVCGYTHFAGSGVYSADGGTSAACPVVAGVIAAIRTRRPYRPGVAQNSPSAIRNLLRSTARDLAPVGFDFRHGYGLIDVKKIISKLRLICFKPSNICKKYPWLCKHYFCRKYPWLCYRNICRVYPILCRRWRLTENPPEEVEYADEFEQNALMDTFNYDAEIDDPQEMAEGNAISSDIEQAFVAGLMMAQDFVGSVPEKVKPEKPCSCQDK